MAKLITKQAAVERDHIVAIIKYRDGVTIKLKKDSGFFIKDCPHYVPIVQWWRSPCEVDLVLDELPKCCYNKRCKCCKFCCNNN